MKQLRCGSSHGLAARAVPGFRRLAFLAVPTVGMLFASLLTSSTPGAAWGQTVPQHRMAIKGNMPAEARSLPRVGRAPHAKQLTMRVTLALHDKAALEVLLAEQQDRNSPQYHRWLTPAQFASRFGPTPQDFGRVRDWLGSMGFSITAVNLARRRIQFAGTASQAEQAFGTTIMTFGDGSLYSNVTEPAIPEEFAGVIGAISGLDNFGQAVPVARSLLAPSVGPVASSKDPVGGLGGLSGPLTLSPIPPRAFLTRSVIPTAITLDDLGDVVQAFGPADLYSFYHENPPASGGFDGSGADCIAIVGVSNFMRAAVSAFNNAFNLPASDITVTLVDGTDSGFNFAEGEALLDLDWSHAVAPAAPQRYYLGDGTHINPTEAVYDAILGAVTENACGVINVSYTLCGVGANDFTDIIDPVLAQGASQGQSIFISSGDSGAAGLAFNPSPGFGVCKVATSRTVSELSADPNVTAVGGTQFAPFYDRNGNNVGDVAESVWNEEALLQNGGATGGGASAVFPKPPWQHGPGVPNDNARDVPDISMLAAVTLPGVVIFDDNRCEDTCTGQGPITVDQIGGTSLSAPVLAGITTLIEEKYGGRVGNINPRLYELAQGGLAAAGIRDVRSGNNGWNGVSGFSAGPGYDLATGWGTLDIATFVDQFVCTIPCADGGCCGGNYPYCGPNKTCWSDPCSTLCGDTCCGPTEQCQANGTCVSHSGPTPTPTPLPGCQSDADCSAPFPNCGPDGNCWSQPCSTLCGNSCCGPDFPNCGPNESCWSEPCVTLCGDTCCGPFQQCQRDGTCTSLPPTPTPSPTSPCRSAADCSAAYPYCGPDGECWKLPCSALCGKGCCGGDFPFCGPNEGCWSDPCSTLCGDTCCGGDFPYCGPDNGCWSDPCVTLCGNDCCGPFQQCQSDGTCTAGQPPCSGDCNSQGTVTRDDILVMVNIALGRADLSNCQTGDLNANKKITVDEVLAAVDNAVSECRSR